MSEFTPTNGQPIPGCRMRMIRVKTDKFKEHDVLARFAANIKGVTAYKEIRPLDCQSGLYCKNKTGDL